MSYVYILKHSSLPLVKIGLSKAPLQRSKQIGSEAFNLSSSCIVRTADESCARRLERVLHLIHDAERQKDERVPFSGATEWFTSTVYEEVLTFVRREAKAFGVVAIEPARHEEGAKPAQRVVLKGEAYKAKCRENAIKKKHQIGRAHWLLWQFLNDVGERISRATVRVAFVEGDLWVFTAHPEAKLFTVGDGLDGYPVVCVHQRQVVPQTTLEQAYIPRAMNFICPSMGDTLRLLLEEVELESGRGMLLANMKTASANELLYVTALARNIPAVNEALGTHVPVIEPPPAVGPTDGYEWVSW